MPFFNPRFKFPIHILQIFLVLLALGGTAVRLLIVKAPAGAPPSRANTMALGMGAKSLIIIAYIMLSEKYQKWNSLKAYMILNSLEVVFWGAVAFLMFQANQKFCVGTNCTISWAVIGVAGVISQVSVYMAILSIMEWRYFKATGMHMGGKEAQHMQIKDDQNEDGRSFQSDIALPERSFDRTRGAQY